MRSTKIMLWLIANVVVVLAWLKLTMEFVNASSTVYNIIGLFGLALAPTLYWVNKLIVSKGWLN